VPSRTKAPPNSDTEAEQQIRDIINSIARARSERDRLEETLRLYTSAGFVSTNPDGEIGSDRTILESVPASTGGRAHGIRGLDDALVIFGSAAVYTYKIRPAASGGPSEGPQQSTVFFAKHDGRWIIAAAHVSKYSSD
jgi:hypothetical protein